MKKDYFFHGLIASFLSILAVFSLLVIDSLPKHFDSQSTLSARALPFGDTCYKLGIFECSDYVYEYCQYNDPNSCWIIQMYDTVMSRLVGGHFINLTAVNFSEPVPGGKGQRFVTRYSVIEPQDKTEQVITSWTQPTGASIMMPDSAKTAIVKKWPGLFYTPESGVYPVANFNYQLISGIQPYSTLYKLKSYWSEGIFPLSTLRKVTKTLYDANYAVPRIPLCSDFDNVACTLRYRPSTEGGGGLNYSGRACRSNAASLPRVTVCINDPKPVDPTLNGKWRKITLTEADPKPVVDVTIILPKVCSLPSSASDKKVTLIATSTALSADWMSEKMGGVAGERTLSVKAEFYIDGVLVGSKEGKTMPLSLDVAVATYRSWNLKNITTKVYLYTTSFDGTQIVGTYTSAPKQIKLDQSECGVATLVDWGVDPASDPLGTGVGARCIEKARMNIYFDEDKYPPNLVQRKSAVIGSIESNKCPDQLIINNANAFNYKWALFAVPFTTPYTTNGTYTLAGDSKGIVITDPNTPPQTFTSGAATLDKPRECFNEIYNWYDVGSQTIVCRDTPRGSDSYYYLGDRGYKKYCMKYVGQGNESACYWYQYP